MYNGYTKQKHYLRFWKLSPEEINKNIQIVIDELDNADFIAGYNVVLFDLEFIRLSFQIPDLKMTHWVKKCFDPFMCSKYILKSTCKLGDLLALNNLASKTGSGAEAIVLAREEKWELLLDYCMMDTTLTYELCSAEWIMFSPTLKGRWESSMWIFQFRNDQKNHQQTELSLPTLLLRPISQAVYDPSP